MNTPSPSRAHLLEKASVGICLRSVDSTVLLQNQVCRAICGDVQGRRCEQACTRFWPRRIPLNDPCDPSGAQMAQGKTLHGLWVDVSVVQGPGACVTLIIPLAERVATLRRYLETMELTPRETEIAALVAIGKSNADIMRVTGLSKATVRTHLNHIHQKLPNKLLARLRDQRRTAVCRS